MNANPSRPISVNGIRYHLAVRQSSNWNHTAEWWNGSEFHKRNLNTRPGTDSDAEQQALHTVHHAHTRRHPLLS